MASGWNDVADLFPGLDAGDLVDAHNYESQPQLDHSGRGQQGGIEILMLLRASLGCFHSSLHVLQEQNYQR